MQSNKKYKAERVVFTFNFTSVDIPVSSPVITVLNNRGVDVTSNIVYGSPRLSQNKVLQLIQNGSAIESPYTAQCQVDVTKTGERFVVRGQFYVED